jgi:hypothetical protein
MAANSGVKKHGRNAAVYIGGPKDGGGVRLSNRNEWSLSLGRDYVDASVFGDTNKTYLAGLRDVQGTINGFLDVSGDLMTQATTSDAILVYLYADDVSVPAILVAGGPGLFDASLTASISDGVKITSNFRAAGSWLVAI